MIQSVKNNSFWTLLLPKALIVFALLSGVARDVAAQDNLSIQPENTQVGAMSLYKFEFTLNETLPVDGAFFFKFPAEFDLLNVSIAASNTIHGGFSVFVKDKKVWVIRKGEGVALQRGKKVDLLLSALKNPDNPGAASISIKIEAAGKKLLQELRTGKHSNASAGSSTISGNVNITLRQ